MNIKTGKICKIGGRQKNDDTAEILLDGGAVRVYVGDGLGSYAGGKQASETAGQALLTYRGSLLDDESLRGAAHLANQSVYALQNSTKGTMKTTIVFLNIEQDKARWMHVGDSRLYHFKNGKLVRQTVDHSVSQMAVMMGEITTHQIRFHEDRNRVLRSLGGENAKPELSEIVDVSEGSHAFLLCTDGFWEYVYEEEMELTLSQAKDPDDWIARMEEILLTRVTGHNDNYTAAVAFVGDQLPAGGYATQKHSAEMPSEPRKAAKPASGKGKGIVVGVALLLAAAVGGAAMLFLNNRPGHGQSPEIAVTESSASEQNETAADSEGEKEARTETAGGVIVETAPETTAQQQEPVIPEDPALPPYIPNTDDPKPDYTLPRCPRPRKMRKQLCRWMRTQKKWQMKKIQKRDLRS